MPGDSTSEPDFNRNPGGREEPLQTFLALFRSDVAARYPDAETHGLRGVARVLLRDPSMRATLMFRVISRSPGRGPLWWRTWEIWRYRCEIYHVDAGPGLLVHSLNGTIIAEGVKLGKRVTLHPGVSIGTARAPEPGTMLPCPVIGDDVTIETGAFIGGAISVGSGSHIGPRCLIAHDVPPGTHVPEGAYR